MMTRKEWNWATSNGIMFAKTIHQWAAGFAQAFGIFFYHVILQNTSK
jgi:hypothetical protein